MKQHQLGYTGHFTQEKVLQDIEKHSRIQVYVCSCTLLLECFFVTLENGKLDTHIIIPIFLLDRHPDSWKDEEKFMPERWLQNASGRPKPFSFLPFSGGGRNCIGEVFARTEAKLIMANLIRRFGIELAPSMQNNKFEFRNSLTVKSNPKVKIVVKSRLT
jgi:hypothetical protein